MLALSREQVQAFDRWAIEQLGVPGVVLMENAGRGCAEVLLREHAVLAGQSHAISGNATSGPAMQQPGDASRPVPEPHPKLVVVCCGRGNNGGDGYVMARHLALMGVPVRVLAFADPDQLSGDARWAANVYRRVGLPLVPLWHTPLDEALLHREITEADWIADALFGTGLKGPLRFPCDRVVQILNASGKPILAVDIPSGLDCDTGQALGVAIRARCTATMAAWKVGFLAQAARDFTGEVHVVSLGVPVQAWLRSTSSMPPPV
ncbi:Bifunctional NAD(P)H-hydrate repair enzyme Nnr [bacterium HR36]|nr:Bifunctional NAD(P)H-hydrate repair enzyme Nnr [bacterium HR36]